ncbi:MAG: hypothetical protein J6B85_01895 [Lachnospiraceae bacterium]|nr:hypothetical protein [Lachnospiraceae bacterium]
MKRFIAALLGCVILASLWNPAVAQASQPDRPYTYDEENQAVPSVNAYQVKEIVDVTSLGGVGFTSAQDLFVDAQDQVYVLDSGKGRVIWLDENFDLVKIIDTFTWNGEALTLAAGAKGIFYQEATGRLYIADTNNDRIVICDRDGAVLQVFGKPESALLEEGVDYKPTKIIVNNLGTMYILSQNVNTGALRIDKDNNFTGFYGINAIKETWEVKMEFMWRQFLTDEQNRQSEYSFQPTALNNLYWSDDRFIYAVSPTNDTVETPVVKLNAVGDNVLEADEVFFGDLAANEVGNSETEVVPVFSDITADQEGVFTVLDSASGKLYQYDDSCNLLAVFGGLGTQRGLFDLPVAIENNSRNEILVLDSKKNTITVMEQTYYGQMIREAIFLHNDGRYEEALEPWFEVLRMNANYYIAYIGIGKAYMNMGDYEQAQYYFKLGGDEENYSEAKAKLRAENLKENFAAVAAVVVLVMIFIMGYDGIKKYAVLAVGALKKRRKGEKV